MALIEDIISIEWQMFRAVNGDGPKASCQSDSGTFGVMRRAQFGAWPEAALESYLADLEAAKDSGRNLLEEKYIHMMKGPFPEKYAVLRQRISAPVFAVRQLAKEINDRLIAQTEALFAKYPNMARTFRPLRSDTDTPWSTSLETYQYGELLTYSEATLKALQEHILALEGQGISMAERIIENSIRPYGFERLADAEARVLERGKK